MRLRIDQLRRAIRTVLKEVYEAEGTEFEDTVLPDEEAEDELIAEPDLTDQRQRDDQIDREKKRKKTKDKLQSDDEIDEDLDEMNTVGAGGIAGHMGGAWGPRQKPKKNKSKSAMSPRSLDEEEAGEAAKDACSFC